MLELCDGGRMGALYIAGSDPLMAYPDRGFVKRALGAADLLIVQDTFLTDTAGLADVVLPAAGYGEESGTFTNNEGRIQKVCKFREPAFEARGNLAIFDFVAALRRPGVAAVDARRSLRRDCPAGSGLPGADAGRAWRRRSIHQGGPDAAGWRVLRPPPAPHAADRLMLVTGNCLFHNGYLSERSEILNTVADDPYVEMSAQDAAQLGLSDGDQVVVRSAQGELTAQLSELMGFIISYPPDAEIYGEGEQAEYFYKVVNGSVRTYKTLKSGRRQIVAFHVPGDVFGLETRGEHTLSADAVAESSLLLIKRSALVALAEQDKDAAGRLWTLTAAELRQVQDHIRLFALPARERVAGFLVEMAQRLSANDEVELPMARQDIADYLGLTVETVSRSFTQLERLDAITVRTSRRILLRNYFALVRLSA